jgi:glycosyltransferase involved in cell wall biosynthesis
LSIKTAIILSVYKNDSLVHLEEALQSILNQNADILIQQDGMVSPEVEVFLDRLLSENSIAYLGKRKQNRGLAYSLNELIVLAKSQGYHYVVRMDADDISMPNRIDKQISFMERNSNIDIVGGYIEEFATDMNYQKVVRYPLVHQKMFDFFAKRVPLAHVSAMYRITYFQKAGLYPTSSKTNEDTLMWMKGFKNACVFANIPEVLVRVRISKAFFSRRAGLTKAWDDLKDRVLVIRTLGYNYTSYFYAIALFMVNIAPGRIKQFLYERLR